MKHVLIWMVLGMAAAAWAAPQTALPGGVFLEAEDFGRLVQGDAGFATQTEDSAASGGRILTGMFNEGLIVYTLQMPAAGRYTLWARCAVPKDATVQFAFGGGGARLEKAAVARAGDPKKALSSYQWRRLGEAELPQGKVELFIGRSAVLFDCFYLTGDAGAKVGDDVLGTLQKVREAPKGEPLPELAHTRAITRHPDWLMKRALRPAYGHFEWDPANTPQSWARRAKEAGANCLFGVGEMPAGTLNGKMHRIPFEAMNKKGYRYPEGYQKDDHSWVKEMVDAGHAEGLKVVIYDAAYRNLDPLLVDHPEWRTKNIKGKDYKVGFGSWNSPYRQAYIDRWVKVARECGIDGIMVDMLFASGLDYSEHNVKAFRDRFGVEPPREEEPRNLVWQRWIDFHIWTREEVMLDVTEALHAANPEIACIWNQALGWHFNGKAMLSSRAGRCGDGLLEEMGWDRMHLYKDRPIAWPLQTAWQSLFLRCRSAYGQMWHLCGMHTRVNHEALSYSMFGNGIAPGIVAGGNWDLLGPVWRQIGACEPFMVGAQLEPHAALHFSEQTLRHYANARGPEATHAYLANVFGWFQALLEAHVPLTIITDDELADAQALKHHAAVILPNSACLSARQAAALEAYAREGGGVVASFETGMFDENGTRREAPVLRGLLGVVQGKSKAGCDWMLPLGNLTHEIANTPEIAGAGEPSQGSAGRKPHAAFFVKHPLRTAGLVSTRADEGVASVPLSGAGGGHSTLHARALGKGRVVYFPPDMGQAFYTYNHPVARTLMIRAVAWGAGRAAPLETSAPMAVQTVMYRKDGAALVHLINDNSSYGRAAAPNPEAYACFRDEILPVRDLRVAVRGEFKKATLLPSGTALNVSFREGMSAVVVPEVQVHAMVVFE
jgi:hypothetical protein